MSAMIISHVFDPGKAMGFNANSPTDEVIGDTGATSLSEALKSNTTLTKLNLWSENTRKKAPNLHPTNHSLRFIFSSSESNVGNSGATSLSESLKSNTTLTELHLRGEDKRRHTKDIHQQFTLSFLFSSTDNNIGDTGAASLSETLRSNTTLNTLDMWSEDKRKKTSKRHPSTIHCFPFSSHQQATRLET